MNFGYNGYGNPYARAYQMPNFNQPQFNPSQQPIMQPTQMPPQVQQPTQPVQYEMPIQYVGYATLKEAEAYILMPNSKAIFIDKANGMYYEKTANNEGQSFIKCFKETSNKTENQAVEPKKEEPKIDLSGYVKKEDLGAFVSVKQYNELSARLEILQKQISGVKSNVGNKQQ